ncbi:hypothetical protein [Bradyrhizobium sp. WSM1253]|uniref:hypothetical protein n=1 Tax=Bradyrhizobium sp. WSM1253 TaxID=319003 RepID=UPI00025D2E69|nr:hypothetical protein [Bradyrhizobium sp. WSM1253]EIG62959.1 hypothetical protein Bra1253DRAFT_07908 [Bradyrhizobium sp. WSM1253]
MSTGPTAFEMIRDFLSKPFVGPILSLIVLTVSLTSLLFAVLAYRRQGVRWENEDAKALNVTLQMFDSLNPQKMRLGRLEFTSQLPYRVRISSVQIGKPVDALISYVEIGNSYLPVVPPAKSFGVDDGQGYEDNNGMGNLVLLIQTQEASDQRRSLVEVTVTFVEVNGSRKLVRTASSVLPPLAATN